MTKFSNSLLRMHNKLIGGYCNWKLMGPPIMDACKVGRDRSPKWRQGRLH